MVLGSLFGMMHSKVSHGSKQSPSPKKTVQVHAACEAFQTGHQAEVFEALMACADEHSCGVVYDAVMEMHLRETHAEHPNRVRELNSKLEREGLLAKCEKLVPKLASTEELLKCHSQAHINKVEQLFNNPINTQGEPAKQEGDTFIISSDIYCNKYTSTAARSAAGCSIQAVHAVLSGKVRSAFAVVRPPGHHAEANDVQGFCFYNNVAVAAHAALGHPGIERVLIVDWDIHHGNGTQKIFEDDSRVLFVSLHRRDKDFYPEGVGYAAEVGTGKGQGFNVNIPWACDERAMLVGDADYLAAFDLVLDPIISQYNPQLVLISAGFDAAEGDILGRCHVTPAGFAAMTQRLQRYADGKVVAVLEGGYVPSIVGECATAVMQVLQGAQPQPTSPRMHKSLSKVLSTVDSIQRQYWSGLAALPPFAARFKEYSNTVAMQAMNLGNEQAPCSPCRATRSATRAAAAGAGAMPVGERVESPTPSAEAPGALKYAAAAKSRADKRAAAAAERKAIAAAKATLSSHALPDVAAEGGAASAELISTAAADATSAAAAVDDSSSAADRLADSLKCLSVSREPSPNSSVTGQGNKGAKEAESTPAAAPAACAGGAPVIIVAAGSCAPVVPISAAPGALQRAASLKARAEQRAKAVAERRELAERRAAAQAAKLALLQAERKAQVAAERAAAMAAAEAEEAAQAAAGGRTGAPAVDAIGPVTAAPPPPANREDRVCVAAMVAQQSSSSVAEKVEPVWAPAAAVVTPERRQPQPDATAVKAEAAAVVMSAMPPTPPSAAPQEVQPCSPPAAAAAAVMTNAPSSDSKKTPSPAKDSSMPDTSSSSSSSSEKPKPSSAARGTNMTHSMAAKETARDSPANDSKAPHSGVKAGSPTLLSMPVKDKVVASAGSASCSPRSTAKACSPKALGEVARETAGRGSGGGSPRSPRSLVDSPIFKSTPAARSTASKPSQAAAVGKWIEKAVQPAAVAAVPGMPVAAVVAAAAAPLPDDI